MCCIYATSIAFSQLINEAATTIERWRAEGFFEKRAQGCLCKTYN